MLVFNNLLNKKLKISDKYNFYVVCDTTDFIKSYPKNYMLG